MLKKFPYVNRPVLGWDFAARNVCASMGSVANDKATNDFMINKLVE